MKENLRKAVEIVRQSQPSVAVVFDLDSTLFCMKYRTEAILKQSIEHKELNLSSEIVSIIEKLEVSERDWSVGDILSRYGVSSEDSTVEALYRYWRKYFFTNDFLHLDRPYNGAVKYVSFLKGEGATVFYLTARSEKQMKEGSLASLEKWGFPLETQSHLILKQDGAMKDSDYKMDELKFIQSRFQTVLFFENEPVVLNVVAERIPQIRLFWMDSVHSQKESPPKTALAISMNYAL